MPFCPGPSSFLLLETWMQRLELQQPGLCPQYKLICRTTLGRTCVFGTRSRLPASGEKNKPQPCLSSTINVMFSMCVCVLSCFSHVWLFVTVALQAPPSRGFSWQEHWSGLSCPPPGDFPDPRAEIMFLMALALAGVSSNAEPPGKPHFLIVAKSNSDIWVCSKYT